MAGADGMKRYVVPRIAEGVFSVGVRDRDRRMFDAFVPLPAGTSYNSYLVLGKKKHALVDTVDRGFEGELLGKMEQLSDMPGLDYVIMNHAEPDHAGAIPAVMEAAPKALLVASHRGAHMAKTFFHVPDGRILLVKEGDMLDLGGLTLSFIEAPMLHWPETMFTYLREEGVIFSCDFFGAHTSSGICDEDVDDIQHMAKRYFGQVMMPFRSQGKKAIERLAGMNLRVIAPGHGPVYKNPKKVLDAYRLWTSGITEEKALVAYVSMWSSTAAIAGALAEELTAEGIDVKVHNLALSDPGELAADLVDSRALAIGSPTFHGGLHPLAIQFMNTVRSLGPPARCGAFFGSYGWAGGAMKAASEFFAHLGIEMAGGLEIHGPPQEKDMLAAADLGRQLAGKIKGTSGGKE
jgi:flavorubredoxin